MERITITKTLKCMFCGVPPSDLSRNVDIKHRGVLTWISDSSLFHGKNRSVFRTYVIHVLMQCCLSICIFISISRGLYQYISSYWHQTFNDFSQSTRMGDSRRTVNTPSTVRAFLISWGKGGGEGVNIFSYAVNWCVSRWNGRDIFFHITSGRINTCKGVNQLKELFFLNLIIIF